MSSRLKWVDSCLNLVCCMYVFVCSMFVLIYKMHHNKCPFMYIFVPKKNNTYSLRVGKCHAQMSRLFLTILKVIVFYVSLKKNQICRHLFMHISLVEEVVNWIVNAYIVVSVFIYTSDVLVLCHSQMSRLSVRSFINICLIVFVFIYRVLYIKKKK